MNKLLIFALLFFTYCTSSKKEKATESANDYFISSQQETDERIKSLNLDKPSEDQSSLLNLELLSFPKIVKGTEQDEYKPNPKLNWIIELSNADKSPFTNSDIDKLLDKTWRAKFPAWIYGLSNKDHKWTFVLGESPEAYDQVQIAVNLPEAFNEEHPDYNPIKLNRYLIELENRKRDYPKLKISAKEKIEDAIARAQHLISVHQQFDEDMAIVLQSEKPYGGLEAWDALQSVGLKWGDGDLFHWENKFDYGSDQHFSVWTTTDPGYFLPEDIKNGTMRPATLVFGYSIPRSADPIHVYEVMVSAAQYCQKRLGGVLLNADGQALQVDREKSKLMLIVDKMSTSGIKPGSDEAMKMF